MCKKSLKKQLRLIQTNNERDYLNFKYKITIDGLKYCQNQSIKQVIQQFQHIYIYLYIRVCVCVCVCVRVYVCACVSNIYAENKNSYIMRSSADLVSMKVMPKTTT